MRRKVFFIISALTIIASFTITSCEKEVKVKLPYEGNKIVLNSLIMRDSLIYARLTNSTELNNTYTFPVPAGAKIDLYENDVLRETMNRISIYGVDYFVSTFKSGAGRKYTLKASASGLTNAGGSDVIPSKPAFTGDKFKTVVSGGISKTKLELKINDPAGEKNYYRLRIYAADTNYSPTGPRIELFKPEYHYFQVDDLVSNNAFDIFDDIEYRQIFFTDDQFDGKEVSLTVELSYYPDNYLYIAPELVALSRDAYRYLQSRENQYNNDGNPFTEAVIIYNNISGGYGIVGGMADSIKAVRRQ